MKSSFIKYFYIIFIIITIGIIFTSCGGDNNIITPVTNNPQNINQSTPPPQTITKHVAGYIYATSGQGSMAENFIILDIPATGQDSFPAQMSGYLQQNYPAEWNKPEIQEIYTQLSDEMVQWKPLLQYKSSAQLFTLYSDPPINVNSDGYFETDVPVQSTDDTVGFEVVLNDKEHFSVNRTSFADLLTSTGGTDGQLKSCSKTVFALPGGITIFKIFATAMNLKESCLTFSLDNSSIGTITPPFYLKIKGQENFSIAYGVFKAVNNASGMAKTGIINAKTSNGVSGQNIPMPVEIIHETVSISGKVFSGGSPLIDGNVKSIGPKSFCHLDTEGNYILPEVFEGTNREIIATWWTDDAGKRTKHVEIRYVDSLNGNLTDFNFGVPPTPTPTFTPIYTPTPTYPPPTDLYYEYITEKIIEQKILWQEELGWEQGIQKTVNWLNGEVIDTPVPLEIKEAIREAKVNEFNSYSMKIYFKSGVIDGITDPNPFPTTVTNTYLQNSVITTSGQAGTVKNLRVLMLGPAAFETGDHHWVFSNIKSSFEKNHYTVTRLGVFTYQLIGGQTPTPSLPPSLTPTPIPDVMFFYPAFKEPKSGKYIMRCSVINGEGLVRPEDFTHMGDYGVVYIMAHGFTNLLMACPFYANDEQLNNWITHVPQNYWEYHEMAFSPFYEEGEFTPKDMIYYRIIALRPEFFRAYPQNLSGSLVYVNGCSTWELHDTNKVFPDAKVYIGNSGWIDIGKGALGAYNFFKYMLGEKNSFMAPMSAREAFNKVSDMFTINYNPEMDTGSKNENDNTYLYTDSATVIMQKK